MWQWYVCLIVIVGCCLTLTFAALILYEHFLTLDDEWDLIWSRKLSASSVIFLVNRAAGIIYTLALILRFAGDSVSDIPSLHALTDRADKMYGIPSHGHSSV